MQNYCLRRFALRPLCVESPAMAGAANPARERGWDRLVAPLNQLAKESGRGRPWV